MIGCGAYEVSLWSRGLRTPIGIFDSWSDVSWGRRRNDTSESTLTFGGAPTRTRACAELLETVDRWLHEIVIVRSPGGLVWSGPVVDWNVGDDTATITAQDLSAWWAVRRIHHTHKHVDVDAAEIFAVYHDDAMAPDPSPGFLMDWGAVGTLATRTVRAGQHLMARDEMNELQRTAVNWIVLDRTCYAGASADGIGVAFRIDDDDLASRPTIQPSDPAASYVGVRGAGGGDGDDPVYRDTTSAAALGRYGLVEVVESEESVLDNASALPAAESRLARYGVSRPGITGLTLSAEADIDMDDLLPGVNANVALADAARPVVDTYRLETLAVTASAGTETITLELS